MQTWRNQELGIVWIVLMIDNPNGGSASLSGAETWKDYWGLDSPAVAADPNYQFVPGNSVGTPQLSIVDPRTMEVISVQEGYSGNYNQLTSLAQQNKL